MKILVVGDFHGKFPSKLFKTAREVDLVISLGDYPSWGLREVFFKECYRTERELWEVVGKKKYKESKLEDWKSSEKILGKLNSLEVPVVTVIGNYDNPRLHDSVDIKKSRSSWKWDEQDFLGKSLKKFPQVKLIDYRAFRVGDFILIGANGHSSPGKVKSRAYRKNRARLERLFKKYSKENKEGRLIFVTHNPPYDTKLDKIRDKSAPKVVRGKHYGSKMYRRLINKFQPILSLSGHMHENQGKEKIGKTLAINAGAANDGKAVVLELSEDKSNRVKIKKVEFLK